MNGVMNPDTAEVGDEIKSLLKVRWWSTAQISIKHVQWAASWSKVKAGQGWDMD